MWDYEAWIQRGLFVDGLADQDGQEPPFSNKRFWSGMTLPVWMMYMAAIATSLITAAQIFSFVSAVPAPPGPTQNVSSLLGVFQHMGISAAALHSAAYFAAFIGVAFTAFCYVLGVMVLNEFLEDRARHAPESAAATAFTCLRLFANVTATVGFIPVIGILARAWPCDGESMREDTSVTCGSGTHNAYIFIALLMIFLTSHVTYRLANVGFYLDGLEIQRGLMVFSASKDSQPLDRKHLHPLSLASWEYEKAILVVKVQMTVSKTLELPELWLSISLFAGACALVLCGILYDKYAPNQIQEGRRLEPNSLQTALDTAVAFTFLGGVFASWYAQQGFDSSSLRWYSWLTPLAFLTGYRLRIILTCSRMKCSLSNRNERDSFRQDVDTPFLEGSSCSQLEVLVS